MIEKGHTIATLDKGYVKLIDWMGGDEDIIEAARMSTGKGFYGWYWEEDTYANVMCGCGAQHLQSALPVDDNDHFICTTCWETLRFTAIPKGKRKLLGKKGQKRDLGLLEFLYSNKHCYTPEMQVLTERGWLRWDECRAQETFLIPDPQNQCLVPETLDVEMFSADEEVFCFESERMSYRVTGEHRMYFKAKYCDSYEIVKAKDMAKWGHFLPIQGLGIPGLDTTVPTNDPGAEFIGFYLGDGSYQGKNRVNFHLRKERKKEYLEDLLHRLGLRFDVKQSNTYWNASVYWVETPDFLRDALGTNLEARSTHKALDIEWLLTKRNQDLFTPSRESLFRGLFRGLVESDGHRSDDRPQIQFSSSSKKLVLLFELLAARLGIDAHRAKSQHDGVYRTAAFPGARTTLEARKQYFRTEHFQGKVYCTTSSTGLLLVRGGDDKFAFVCGNSTPFEMGELAIEVKAPLMVFREWHRHRTQCLSGDTEVHFDMPARLRKGKKGIYKMTMKELWRKWQPTSRKEYPERQVNPYWPRERIKGMLLRSLDEDTGEVITTHITDVIRSEAKPLYRITTASGKSIKASKDHRFFTDCGWQRLEELATLPTEQNTSWEARCMLTISTTARNFAKSWDPPPVDIFEEVWKPVVGWEGLYEVSNFGRVKRVGSYVQGDGVKAPTVAKKSGYPVISLSAKGKTFVRTVHTLVLEAFIGPKRHGQEARHKDHNKLNCVLSNLSWGSSGDNSEDMKKADRTQRLVSMHDEIINIELLPPETTYDLTVSGPFHNFIAEGIVVHNSYNEMSGRYSKIPNEHYVHPPERFARKTSGNKQEISLFLDGMGDVDPDLFIDWIEAEQQDIFDNYEKMLAAGVPKEVARTNCPLSRYSKMRAKTDVRNWLAFLMLRMPNNAMWEIRQYAYAVATFIRELFPRTFALFVEHDFYGVRFSRTEMKVLREIVNKTSLPSMGLSDKEMKRLLQKLSHDLEEDYRDVPVLQDI